MLSDRPWEHFASQEVGHEWSDDFRLAQMNVMIAWCCHHRVLKHRQTEREGTITTLVEYSQHFVYFHFVPVAKLTFLSRKPWRSAVVNLLWAGSENILSKLLSALEKKRFGTHLVILRIKYGKFLIEKMQTKTFNTLTEQLEERLESSPGTPDSAPNWCVLCFSENTRIKKKTHACCTSWMLNFWWWLWRGGGAYRSLQSGGGGCGGKKVWEVEKGLTKLTRRSLENTNPAKEKHFELAADERKQSEITSLWEVEKR